MSLNANVLAALNPYLQADLGLGDDQLGGIAGAAGLAGTAGALLLGPMVDRIGRRPPLLWGTALFLIASCGYLVADSYPALIAVRLVTGFVAGIVLTSASSAVADLIPYERRGLAMGIVTAGILLAVPVGMPIAIALAEAGWWRGIFVVQIGASLLTLGALALTLEPGLGRGGRRVRQIEVLRSPAVLAALGSIALYNGAFFATMQFLGKWLDEVGILARGNQAWMWITLGLVSALGGAVLGGVSDRIGKRRFVLIATAVVAVGLVLLSRIDALTALIVVGVPVGVVSASRSGALLALVSELVPADARGTLMGVRTAAVNLGTGTFPWLAGYVYQEAGFPLFLHIAAGSMFAAWLLVRVGVPEPGGRA
jgi:predicted MFS family arabinose efflux permease